MFPTHETSPLAGTTEAIAGIEKEFRASIDGALPWRARIAALTCLVGNAAFVALDFLATSGGILTFRVAARAAFTPIFLLLWWLASSTFGRENPHLPVLALAGALATEMGILGSRLPPAESVGFFPAMLFFTVFLPLPRRRAAFMAAIFVLGFLVPQLLIEPWPLGPIVKQTGNLLAAGVIGLVASHMSDTLARREFVAQRRLLTTGARLEALARTKDRFFTEVSTELRTPLTAALIALETSRLEEAEQAPITRPLQRMHKLVDELLTLSRVDTGVAQGKVTDLVAAALRLTDEFHGAFASRGLTLSRHLVPGPLRVRIGGETLGRILANLLGRALQLLPRGGFVTVRTLARDGFAIIEVVDDGPAITPTDLPHVFERFAPLSTSPGDEGTGIALAVARGLTELHQGRLSCVSTLGAGTTFRASFPLVQDEGLFEPDTGRSAQFAKGAIAAALDGTEVLGAAPVSDPPPVSAPLVLVIEDHLDLASRLQASIGPSARVRLMPDAETALAQLRELRPDLVISEALLPSGHLSGLQLARRVREMPGAAATPILLLSALTDREHMLAALRSGADDVLGKPFDGAMLRARVESLLLLKKQRDEAQESKALLRALCNGFARALGWESVVLLVPAENGTLSPLAWGGLPPAQGPWGDRTSPWFNGPPRALVTQGHAEEPSPAALQGQGAVALAPLESRGQPGVLLGVSGSPLKIEERQLDGLKAAAASVGALLDRERRADALEQVAEDRRRLSTAVVNGQDAERRRLALELHDGAGQVLVGVLLQLDLGLKGDRGQEPLRTARSLALQALAEIRAFAQDLHPPLLAQHGLKETLRELARQMTSERPAVSAEIGPTVPDTLPVALSLNLFRIAQAALANAVRHANARAIVLRLSARPGEVVLEIEDDGEGFLPMLARHGVGLLGMRERAESLGGTLELTSDLGRGTRVRCRVPVRAARDQETAALG